VVLFADENFPLRVVEELRHFTSPERSFESTVLGLKAGQPLGVSATLLRSFSRP